jgi:hypothetical protein
VLNRIFMAWGVVGRTFGQWLAPGLTLVFFLNLRLVVAFGMMLDHIFFGSKLRKAKVVRPIIIVGTPRSGTTFIHRYLTDELEVGTGLQLFRGLYPSMTLQVFIKPLLPFLEKFSPTRYHSKDAHDTGLTKVETDDSSIFLRYLDGIFFYCFLLSFDETDHVDFVDPRKRDTSARDFAWIRRVWRANLAATGGNRVVAKMFTASLRLPELFKTFPDAYVLYTVRDPLAVMPSTMSLVTTPLENKFKFWSLPEDVRNRFLSRMYKGNMLLYRGFYDHLKAGAFDRNKVFMVPYERMMQDFDGLMEELLPFIGETMSDERRAMIKATADKQRARVSKHKYSLERFGLDADQIRQDCAFVYEELLETPSARASEG